MLIIIGTGGCRCPPLVGICAAEIDVLRLVVAQGEPEFGHLVGPRDVPVIVLGEPEPSVDGDVAGHQCEARTPALVET
jgi:hypothetical protein